MRAPKIVPMCARCAQPALVRTRSGDVLCETCYARAAHEEISKGVQQPTSPTRETKNMREQMPLVAAFVDKMRAAFGRELIDGAIRQGMRSGVFDPAHPAGGFRASENGYTVGMQARHARAA
jgi:hypothetical protein